MYRARLTAELAHQVRLHPEAQLRQGLQRLQGETSRHLHQLLLLMRAQVCGAVGNSVCCVGRYEGGGP